MISLATRSCCHIARVSHKRPHFILGSVWWYCKEVSSSILCRFLLWLFLNNNFTKLLFKTSTISIYNICEQVQLNLHKQMSHKIHMFIRPACFAWSIEISRSNKKEPSHLLSRCNDLLHVCVSMYVKCSAEMYFYSRCWCIGIRRQLTVATNYRNAEWNC